MKTLGDEEKRIKIKIEELREKIMKNMKNKPPGYGGLA